MKIQINEIKKMQQLAGIIEEDYSKSTSDRILELIKMYVDNYFDEGMSAEAALEKIDEILQGKLDDYDQAFLKGEEDNY